MTKRRLISLLLGLILGQTISLAHGIEHAISGQDHQVCITCLSASHKCGFVPSATPPEPLCRHIVPDFAPVADSVYPCQCGYSSRAPPPALS